MPSSAQTVGELGAERRRSRRRSTLLTSIARLDTLRTALARVARNKAAAGGVDDATVESFAANAEIELRSIRDRLRKETYAFSRLRPVAIDKKGKTGHRPILIPTVADRVVQRAILHTVAGPLAPHLSHRNSFAFRRDGGVCAAVHRLRDHIRDGCRVVLVVDIVEFFPSIDSDRLFAELIDLLPDRSIEALLRQLARWEIDDLSSLPQNKRGCFPQAGKGVPQGSALSPMLSNFYMRHLDGEAERRGLNAIRYADDIAIACRTVEEAQGAFSWLESELASLALRVHPLGTRKSRLVEIGSKGQAGIDYLGFFLAPSHRGVGVRPCRAAIDHALNEVRDCFDISSVAGLSERYVRLSHFLNSWLSTYSHVCGSVIREQALLMDEAHRSLSRLLVQRGLLPKDGGLTREQRQFLGVDSIFARAELRKATARVATAVRRSTRLVRSAQQGQRLQAS